MSIENQINAEHASQELVFDEARAVCDCGEPCDVTGYCDDCFGG